MRNNYLLFIGIFICTLFNGYSQDIEGLLRQYADAIVKETDFEFVDKESGETVSSARNLEIQQHLAIESEFLRWRYTSGLVYDGLMELGMELNEEKYINFVNRVFAFYFDNQNYYERVKNRGYSIEGMENFMRFKGIWDDGAQAAALVNVYGDDQRAEYLKYMQQVADSFFGYEKNDDSKRRNQNIDQIYAKGVFMARMGRLTGERKYFDYCVRQVLETDLLFYDPMTGLYNQYYYPHLNVTNNIKWLRGIGWAAMGIVNILSDLPEDHPGYEKVLRVFRKMVIAMSSFQTKSGLWRHLVDRADCFEETSGTAYIVYAIAKGINGGMLDPMYRDVAMAGWRGIVSMQNGDGSFRNVTSGVSGSTSPSYYYSNSFDEASTHFFWPPVSCGSRDDETLQEV